METRKALTDEQRHAKVFVCLRLPVSALRLSVNDLGVRSLPCAF